MRRVRSSLLGPSVGTRSLRRVRPTCAPTTADPTIIASDATGGFSIPHAPHERNSNSAPVCSYLVVKSALQNLFLSRVYNSGDKMNSTIDVGVRLKQGNHQYERCGPRQGAICVCAC